MVFMDTKENREIAIRHNNKLEEMEKAKHELFEISKEFKTEYKP